MSSTVSEFEKIQFDRELYSDFMYPYLIEILEYRGIRFTRIEEMDKIGKNGKVSTFKNWKTRRNCMGLE